MSEIEKIPVTMHPNALSALGEDLVTSDSVAILELVKNSYDAFGMDVELSFHMDEGGEQSIYLTDDGFGMTIDTIKNAWATVATPFKKKNAQHVIARLAGFHKWTELIKASEPALELGKLLLKNRQIYQEKQGYFTDLVESMIVADWKEYEQQYLKDLDDEAKLEVFKKVFLDEEPAKNNKGAKITLNFKGATNPQDMLKKIMRAKGLSPEKAILSSITQKNCIRIIETGWAGIALPLWGHADPDGEFEKLDNPVVEIKLSKDKERLVDLIMKKEKVPFQQAILYFMLFMLESLGYHI